MGNFFGGMKVLTLDEETGMRGKEADVWAMCNRIIVKHKAPQQKAWLVE